MAVVKEVVVERERGTLSKTLPKRTTPIFALFNLVATGLAVLVFRSQVETRQEWPAVVVGSALSSLATIGGIVYADSSIHAFFLGLAILATYIVDGIATGNDGVETMIVALSLSRVMFGVAVASRIPIMKRLFAIFSTKIILNSIMIASICCLPLLSFLMGVSMLLAQDSSVKLSVGAPVMLAIATLILSGLYYLNRPNKHGNLILQDYQQGMTVVTALALAYTAQYSQVNQQVASTFLPILVGSSVTTLLSLVFASVASAWDSVGSGQFQMISLDTAALIMYVVAPLLVLTNIACNKYGDTVHETVGGLLRDSISDEFIERQERPPEQVMISGLFLLLSMATMIGISLVNMQCPLAAYLLSKAYTNGQPRTRQVAICVHFKDFLCESKEKMDAIVEQLVKRATPEKKTVVNIFVTADELRLFSDAIRKLKSAGHAFGICSSTVEGIAQAYEAYMEILKTEPLWYHVGGTTSVSRGPDALKTARELNLEVAFWSTHIGVTSREVLLEQDLPSLREDVATTRGGSFIYLTDDWSDSEAVMAAIDTIVQDLEANDYSFSALSNVASEDPPMTL